MISLDCNTQFFKLKAVHGSANFAVDREKAKTIPGRRPIWGIDQATKRNIFQYWEVPRHAISSITSLWSVDDIIATDEARKVITDFAKSKDLPSDLTPLSDEGFEWGEGLEPKSYQRSYVLINASKNRLVCSFWLGMGKTYGALWRAKILGFEGLLLVCPANPNLRNKWVKSVRRIFGEAFIVVNYEGTVRKRKKLLVEKVPSAKVVLVSHSLAKELANESFDQIIIDEAHLLSNPGTKIFKSVCKLIFNNPSAGVQLVTGTPINHKLQDIWGLLYLIAPDVAGDRSEWEKRYVKVLRSFPKRMKWGAVKHIPLQTEPHNTDELRARIAPFVIRVMPDGHITYKDTTEIIPVPLKERQRQLYKEIRQKVLEEIDQENASTSSALAKTMKVIRVCEGAYHINPDWEDSSKMDYVVQELKAARETGEKILVWSISVDTVQRLHKLFSDSVMFTGSLSDKEKNMAVWSFHGVEDEHEQTMFDAYRKQHGWAFKPAEAQFFFAVVHPKSSNGIDLHIAARQIFMSFHWNGNANMQAKGRLARVGQTAPEVKTEFLVAEKTFEEKALRLILSNYQVTLDILDGRASGQYRKVTELITCLRKSA